MPYFSKITGISIILLIIVSASACGRNTDKSANSSSNLDSLLLQLDEILRQRDSIGSERRAKIETAKDDLASCHTDADRYEVLRSLYSAYRGFRIDSALIVADMRLGAARELEDPSKVITATINLAESYANAGELRKAADLLEGINTGKSSAPHKKYYYNVLNEVYTRLRNSAVTTSDRTYYTRLESSTLDTLLDIAAPTSTSGLLLQARKLSSSGHRDQALRCLRQIDTTDIKAPQLYAIGQVYLELGDTARSTPLLAKAAISDLRSGVKEYAALIDLATVLHSKGESERAYRYINVAFDDAKFSSANFRTQEIMKILPVIDSQFYRMKQESMRHTARQRTIAIVFAILMLIAVVIVLFQTRRLHRLSQRLNDTNCALEQSNASLRHADNVKLEYVTALLQTYAACDTTLRDFRRSIYRLLKAGQTEKAVDLVRSDKMNTDAFYGIFDSAVISMFPQFIDTVNKYMKQPYRPKSGGALVPELRVIAMIKLDINSIEDIARMLHYSNQTVYNYRSAIRANLIIPEDEFRGILREI